MQMEKAYDAYRLLSNLWEESIELSGINSRTSKFLKSKMDMAYAKWLSLAKV